MRLKRQTKITEEAQFHITVGSAPEVDNTNTDQRHSGFSLDRELRLVKAALLYGDQVTLCSLSTSLLLSLLAIGNLTAKQKLEFLTPLLPTLLKDPINEDVIRNLHIMAQAMDNKQKLSSNQIAFINQLEEKIEEMWAPAQGKFLQYAQEAGAEGLLKAVNSGILKIHILGQKQLRGKPIIKVNNPRKNKPLDKDVIEYMDYIARAVLDRRTYPLFDDMTGNIIQQAINEKKLNVSNIGISRGKQSVLAGALLERLPLFDEATIDEILDIRKELYKPLVRFRKAIIIFSEDMRTAAWDKDFPGEADQLFHKDIAPAVLEIEESLKSTKSLLMFFERVARKPLVGGGVLSVILSQMGALPNLLPSPITVAGGLAAAGLTTLVEYGEILKERKNIEHNQLYFYYRAGKMLQN